MGHSSKAGENIFWAMNRNKPGIIKRILNALERFIARIRGKDAYLAVEQRQAAERLRDMLTGELKRAYGTEVKGEAAVESGEGKRHSLAGANSRTADLNSLGGAYQMYQNGVSMDTIRKRTGWWLGKDGKWRYEISDKEMRFNPEGYVDNPQTVGDYVKHDRLFAAYPWIMDVNVLMSENVAGDPNSLGRYVPSENFIELKTGVPTEKTKHVLIHELQHAIQNKEHFTNGTNSTVTSRYIVNLAYNNVKNNPEFKAEKSPRGKMDYIIGYLEARMDANFDDIAKYYYSRNHGEIEAQYVDKRLDMSDNARKAEPIVNYGDVYTREDVRADFIDNLKEMGYNEEQVNEILEEGIPYDNKHQNEQESLGQTGEGRKNLAGEAGRLPRQGTQRGERREVYRTGKVQVADSVKKTGQVDSLSDSTIFRRGRTDSETGRNDVREAQKRLNEVSKPEKRFSLSSADTDIYSRIFDMQREETELTNRIREIEKSDAFKNANNDLSKAIDSDNIAEGMKAYQAWRKESGYADLVDRRDALRAELEEIRTKANNDAVSKAINEERTAIEKSGLSEADYFRKQAVKEFGYTPYFYDAGYIMPNGKMLNFSGEKGRHYGSRGQDHRAIGTIYADTNGTDALVRFMNDGNIRIMAETPGLDISASTEPSKEQYTTIRRFANEFSDGGYFAVDLSDENGKNVGTLEYEGNINPTRIVNDIKHFYETGEVREQSGLDRFRYSLTRANDEYMKAVESGNVEEQQRLVDEAAENAGYDSSILLHHGTNKFGFTKIDVAESDDGISFFATDKLDTAASYIPYYENGDAYDGIREIGKRTGKNRKVLTADSSIEDFLKYLKGVYPEEYRDARVITKEERYKFAEWDVSDAVKQAKRLLQYSIPKNVEDLVNMVIESEDNKSQWESIARAYGSFKDIPEITYNGMYFNEASDIWHNLQDRIRLLNIYLTKDLAIVNELPKSKDELLYSYEQFTGGENVGIYGLYAKHEGQLVIRGWGSNWNSIPLGDITEKFNDWWVNEKGHEPAYDGFYTRGNTRNIAEFAKFAGYRSVCFVDIYDIGAYGGGYGDLANIYAFFYPESDVKSADPITYDDSGNVIPLTERFDSGNRDIRYSLVKSAQSELKALQKENDKLRQDVDDLKQELQLTHGRKLSRDALISSIQKILIDKYGVKLPAKELYPHVTNLYDMFYNNTVDGKRLKKDERVDTMRIIEEMDKIVDAVIENAVGVDDTYVEMKKLLPELRNTKLVVPMDARADAAQSAGFENWAEFRKANFGRVGFANEGLPVDSYYMELSERYPELFPDGITHPGEQAAHIADVVNTIRESGINEYQLYDIEDERIRTSIKNDVMDIIGNAEKLQTFADRAAQKVEDTKLAEAVHYGADIAKQRRLNAEKVAGIKAENRKRLSDMRRKYQDRVESVRERYAEARANRSEKQKQTVLRNKVLRKYTEASSMLDRPTTENHFTEAMRKPLMEFLAAVDITTGKSMAKQGIYDRILRVIEAANKVTAEGDENGLGIAETDLNVQEKQLIVDSGLLERMAAWVEANQGKKLTELSSAQLFDQIVSNEPPVGYVHLDFLQQPYFAADTVQISYEQHTEKNLRLDSRASVILAVIRLADSAGTSFSNTILSQA